MPKQQTTPTKDGRGKFAKGNSGGGRPKGIANETTLDLREIRRRIVNSWLTVDGDHLLEDIAREQPLDYLKLIVALMPKPTDGEAIRPILIVVRSDAGMAFAETLQQQAQRLPALESPHIVEALRTVTPDLDFNGVNNGNGDETAT